MKNSTSLYEQLKAYGDSDYYPFHMPGHKRNPEFLDLSRAVRMDITEIDGFDDMHHPEGVIMEAQTRAAALYGADETRFLVNGSSSGIIAAILGSCGRGDRILVARNCHKSVYHALEMGGLNPVYVYPQVHKNLGIYGSICPEDVACMLKKYPDIRAMMITSPTYEGVVSDIRSIADIVHQWDIPLIVDEAHGAHFGFSEYFPQTAVRCGADVVIQSVHKTLPSLTQTALLHINGSIARRAQILKYYSYMQTTSPSYVMMASIDHCMTLLAQQKENLFDNYRQMLTEFLNRCGHLNNISILSCADFEKDTAFDFDMSKIVISLKNVKACGKWLHDLLLDKYHLQMEMVSRDYVLAMTSICDTREGFERLYQALEAIDVMDMTALPSYPVYMLEGTDDDGRCLLPEMTPYEASQRNGKMVGFWESEGCISAEFAYVYPPGIPFLVPGEKITGMHLKKMENYLNEGFTIEGVSDASLKQMRVLVKEQKKV